MIERIPPLVLKVKSLPLSLNEWKRDWRIRKNQQDKWKILLYQAFGSDRRQQVFMHGVWFPGRVKITTFVHVAGNRIYDLDNLAPKAIIDALKGIVFVDDNMDILRPITLDGGRIPAGHPSWTEITIEDMRDG